MKKYDVYIHFEYYSHEDYTIECDTDKEAIEKAKEIIIQGFACIEADEPSWCYLNITKGGRKVYDGTLYPCLDGVTEKLEA